MLRSPRKSASLGRIETSEDKRSTSTGAGSSLSAQSTGIPSAVRASGDGRAPRTRQLRQRPAPSKPVGPEDSVFALEYIDPAAHRPDAHHARARFELLG